MLLVSKALAQ